MSLMEEKYLSSGQPQKYGNCNVKCFCLKQLIKFINEGKWQEFKDQLMCIAAILNVFHKLTSVFLCLI